MKPDPWAKAHLHSTGPISWGGGDGAGRAFRGYPAAPCLILADHQPASDSPTPAGPGTLPGLYLQSLVYH